MTPFASKLRAALKNKWMDNDHDIDMGKLIAWASKEEKREVTKEELIGIIQQYESELIATKFIIR